MEVCLHKSGLKDEKKGSDSNGDEESCVDETVLQIGAGKRAQDQDDDHVMKTSSPNHKSLTSSKQSVATTKKERSSESESRSSSTTKREHMDNELGSTKAEMDQVMEENQRLKLYLDRILDDYRTLQTQYRDVIQHDQAKRSSHDHDHKQESDHHEHIDLSLGMSSSDRSTKDEHHHRIKMPLTTNGGADNKQGLTLGLDCRFNVSEKLIEPEVDQLRPSSINPSRENSLEESKEEGAETMWPPKTNMKNVRDDGGSGGDAEISQQNPAKRARVSVRVRCDTPTMNDGCQWRKYGQKIAKGNPCPRAYYRCTVAPSCPVRKQVQRCAEDMSILITTYEGTHNHPLPMSATAMASTTSAAASMLISGSSTSGPNPSSTTTASATLNGLNFYLSSDNSRSKPYYLPNSSISSSPSFPTITLDLTSNSSVSSSLSSSSSHLSRLNHFPPRYSTTNLNFSSLESNPLPLSWSNGMLSYGSQINNKNQTPSSLSFGPHQPYDQTLYQSYLQKSTLPNPNPSHQSLPPNHSHQPLPPNTIAAITSDPSFQSALAAALSSIIGSGAATNNNSSTLADQNIIERSTIKNGEAFPVLSSFPSTSPNANKCAPSFLNKSPPSTSSSQTGNFAFLSTPFSSSKSKSNSPGDHSRDH